MDNLINIGPRLEKIRKIKGFSQEYIAGKLNISQNSYSKIERGESKITLDKLPEICNALEIDLNTLLNFDPAQIFTNCTQSGYVTNPIYNHNPLEKVVEVYEKLLLEKDERIKILEAGRNS
ncbi:MAG: helix-turn-helix domain-containing protein [Bacteroidota bacterium]